MGGPILDVDTNRVIGIISDHHKSSYSVNDIYKTLSLAIPVESIIKVYPEFKDKNPGLKPIYDFLSTAYWKQGLQQLNYMAN